MSIIDTLTIARRFNGPPESANGGYVCGVLARYVEGAAEVTLRSPPPLEKPLTVRREADGRVALLDEAVLVAEAKAARLELTPPSAPSATAAHNAMARYVGFHTHAFPYCFVCGPARKTGDGLLIFTGELAGTNAVAAPWTPDRSLGDENGIVRPEFLWSALDCPGYWASLEGADPIPALLGRLTAEVTPGLRVGEECTVLGWPIAHQGRKRTVGTALFAGERLVGKGMAVWIELQGG